MDFRENDLCAGGSDVNPDAVERYMILDPQRIFFERPVSLEVVVVVIGLPVVPVVQGVAETVIGESMAGRIFPVRLRGHLPNMATSLPALNDWHFARNPASGGNRPACPACATSPEVYGNLPPGHGRSAMEDFIAGLVSQLDSGKIGRRQFCETVALAAIVYAAGP